MANPHYRESQGRECAGYAVKNQQSRDGANEFSVQSTESSFPLGKTRC
jgi:hypothetical protein